MIFEMQASELTKNQVGKNLLTWKKSRSATGRQISVSRLLQCDIFSRWFVWMDMMKKSGYKISSYLNG